MTSMIVLDGVEHHLIEGDCDQCWPDFPHPCRVPGCKGLVHAAWAGYLDTEELNCRCSDCDDTTDGFDAEVLGANKV